MLKAKTLVENNAPLTLKNLMRVNTDKWKPESEIKYFQNIERFEPGYFSPGKYYFRNTIRFLSTSTGEITYSPHILALTRGSKWSTDYIFRKIGVRENKVQTAGAVITLTEADVADYLNIKCFHFVGIDDVSVGLNYRDTLIVNIDFLEEKFPYFKTLTTEQQTAILDEAFPSLSAGEYLTIGQKLKNVWNFNNIRKDYYDYELLPRNSIKLTLKAYPIPNLLSGTIGLSSLNEETNQKVKMGDMIFFRGYMKEEKRTNGADTEVWKYVYHGPVQGHEIPPEDSNIRVVSQVGQEDFFYSAKKTTYVVPSTSTGQTYFALGENPDVAVGDSLSIREASVYNLSRSGWYLVLLLQEGLKTIEEIQDWFNANIPFFEGEISFPVKAKFKEESQSTSKIEILTNLSNNPISEDFVDKFDVVKYPLLSSNKIYYTRAYFISEQASRGRIVSFINGIYNWIAVDDTFDKTEHELSGILVTSSIRAEDFIFIQSRDSQEGLSKIKVEKIIFFDITDLINNYSYFSSQSDENKKAILDKGIPYTPAGQSFVVGGILKNLVTSFLTEGAYNLTTIEAGYEYRREQEQVGVKYSRFGYDFLGKGVSSGDSTYSAMKITKNEVGVTLTIEGTYGFIRGELNKNTIGKVSSYGKSVRESSGFCSPFIYWGIEDTDYINAEAGIIRFEDRIFVNLTQSGWYLKLLLLGYETDEEIKAWLDEYIPFFEDTMLFPIEGEPTRKLSFLPDGLVKAEEFIEVSGAEAFEETEIQALPENVAFRILPKGKAVANLFSEESSTIQVVRDL